MAQLSIIFFLYFFTVVNGLITRQGQEEDLPEYSEYLRRLEVKKALEKTTAVILPKSTQGPEMFKEVPIDPSFQQMPFIQLCKKSPEKDDLYGHVHCWLTLLAYGLLILTLIIYQVRLLLTLKEAQTKRQTSRDLEANGDPSNK
jgi:hypothetical protein